MHYLCIVIKWGRENTKNVEGLGGVSREGRCRVDIARYSLLFYTAYLVESSEDHQNDGLLCWN